MSKFNYKAKNAQGLVQKGIVEANNVKHAVNLLHEEGLFIITVKETGKSFTSIKMPTANVAFDDVVNFTRQISTMITAGLTLVEALKILSEQIKKASLLKLITHIQEEVQGGKPFADILEKYPRIFPPIYLALVRAGEASGKLDVILGRLADNLEKSRDFKNKVKGTLVYPAIVVIGMVVVSIIVMTVVVPRLTGLYKEFGVDLPLPTKILIAMSNFITHQWWMMIIIIVLLVFSYLRFSRSKFGQRILATITLNVPVFGPLIKEATLVEITRTLSLLIEGGIPILTSLDIARDATSNMLYKEAFAEARKKVEKGYPLSDPFNENKLFPAILGQMVSVGEQTGKLGDSLSKLSKYFETEADNAVRSLTTMIEPLIMIILGLGVGFLVMAILLPIYSLTSSF